MKAVPKQKINMIEDPPGRALIWFAIPIIIGNLFQQFYNMVDSIVVGKFVGEEALAAVGASYAVTNVFIAIAIGGGIGSSVVISQYYGAQQLEKMKTSIYTALINFAAVGIILSLIGTIFCGGILRALHTPGNVMGDAAVYLRIYFFGLPFMFLYNIMSSVFNALGDSQTPLKLLIFSSVFNIILDIVLVVGFGRGVEGVAVATLAAQGLSAILSFFILMGRLKDYEAGSIQKYSKSISWKMTRVAIPSIIQQSIVHMGILLVQSVVNGFGSSVLAGYTAGMRFESICVVPMIAAGNAVSTFTAQNMGAKRPERVREGYHAGLRIVITVAVALIIILQLSGTGLLTLFLDAETGKTAYETGLAYLHFEAFFYVMIGAKACTDGVLRGSGDMAVFTTANLVNLGIRVWFAHVFAPVIGVQAVWYAIPMGWTANFVISYAWYRTGKWKKKKVI